MALTHSPAIITEGLVLHLDAGNPRSFPRNGTAWRDLSRRGNDGTLTNGPTFSTANGGGVVFDGTNDYINFGQVNNLKFLNSNPYSFSSWLYFVPISSVLFCYGFVVGSSPTTGDAGYYATLLNNGSFYFDYYDGNSFIGIQGNSNSIPANTWCYICGTNNGTNNANGLKIYVNGVLVQSSIRGNSNPNSINYTNANFNLGARDSKSVFNGNISIFSIYNYALTQSEIQQNFNATRGRFGV